MEKTVIIEWLQGKYIEVDNSSYVEAELLDLVQKHKPAFDKNVVNEVGKADNTIVLRLPPYHCNFNMIEGD